MSYKNIIIQIEKSYYLVQLKNKLNKYYIDSITKDDLLNYKNEDNYCLLNFPISRRHLNIPKHIKSKELRKQYLLQKLDSKDSFLIFFDSLKQSEENETTVVCDEIKKDVYFESLKQATDKELECITNIQFVLSLMAKRFSSNQRVIYVFELDESIELFIIKDDKAEYYRSVKKQVNVEAVQNEVENTISYILKYYHSFIDNKVVFMNDVNPHFFSKSSAKIETIDIISNCIIENSIEKNSLNKSLIILAIGTLLAKNYDLNLLSEIVAKRNRINLIYNFLTIGLLIILSYEVYLIDINFRKIDVINENSRNLSLKIQEFHSSNNKILNEKELKYLENYISDKDDTLIKLDEILNHISHINPNLRLLDIRMIEDNKKKFLNLSFEIKEDNIEKLSLLKIEFENSFKDTFKENCSLKCIIDIRNLKLFLDLSFGKK